MNTVCVFGIYDPEYSRNRVLIRGFKENGWEVVECRVDPQVQRGFSKYRALIRSWRGIKSKLRANDVDLTCILVAFPGHTVMWLARILFFGKKIVFDAFLSRYDSNVYDRKAYGLWSIRGIADWALDVTSCFFADIIMLDTKEHATFFSEYLFVRPDKIISIPVSTDTSIFYPRRVSLKRDKFEVYFHGTFIPLQGVTYILDAARLLRQQTDIIFTIVGSGQQYNNMSELISDEKLSNVKLLGPKPFEDLPSYISQADICLGIFGYTDKATRVIPNKVYEYVAMRKAVITADTPAIREFFTNGVDMILCKRADSKSLADAILKLKHDPQTVASLATNAYNLFESKLRSQKVVADLIDYLHI